MAATSTATAQVTEQWLSTQLWASSAESPTVYCKPRVVFPYGNESDTDDDWFKQLDTTRPTPATRDASQIASVWHNSPTLLARYFEIAERAIVSWETLRPRRQIIHSPTEEVNPPTLKLELRRPYDNYANRRIPEQFFSSISIIDELAEPLRLDSSISLNMLRLIESPVPSLFHPKTRILEMEEKVRQFGQLPENWDSYGASPISFDMIEAAQEILTVAINLELPEPWVEPGGDGGIGILWEVSDIVFYIDLIPGQNTTYVLRSTDDCVDEEDGVLVPADLDRLLRRFAKLTT